MGKIFCISCILFSVIANHATAKEYTGKNLEEMGAIYIDFTVEDIKVYNIIAKTDSGKEINIKTGKETLFYPPEQRLHKGDIARVWVFELFDASDYVEKPMFAHLIEVLKPAKRDFLISPQIGVLTLHDDQSKTGFYIPTTDKVYKFENFRSSLTEETLIVAGEKYELKFDVVPAKIGNGYVYVLKSVNQFVNFR